MVIAMACRKAERIVWKVTRRVRTITKMDSFVQRVYNSLQDPSIFLPSETLEKQATQQVNLHNL